MSSENATIVEELIDIFDREGQFVSTETRKDFGVLNKKSYSETGELQYMVKSATAMLVNGNGDYILVQRGMTEDEAGIIDKTVSGHVSSGDDYGETIVRELKEEVNIDSVIAKDEAEFKRLIEEIDTTKTAVLFQLAVKEIIYKYDGAEPYEKGFLAGVYTGLYNGEIIEFPDGEAAASIVIKSNEILKKIEENPELYTTSIAPLIKQYGSQIFDLLNK
ncbi:MAG: NUDIX hydrolase [Candidatus Gracilibacteria bacterium]